MALLIAGLIETFYEDLWNSWDDSAVDDTLGTTFEFRGSLGQQTTGRDEWRSYRDFIRAGSADFHNEVVALVGEGQRAAARLRYTGTHTGSLLGLPATGRRLITPVRPSSSRTANDSSARGRSAISTDFVDSLSDGSFD